MNPYGRCAALVSLAILGACTHLQSMLPIGSAAERLARNVTIVRDEWGVPAILAPTDASAAFGLAWAQAEDGWWHIEENYIHALGRASNWYGDRLMAADLAQHAIEVEQRAREAYNSQTPEQREFWDAYAEGLNYYLLMTGVRPRLIAHVEPWMPLALELANVVRAVVDTSAMPAVAAVAAVRPDGAMLIENARGDYAGPRQRYEAMVLSAEGWHVRGFTRPGSPAFVSGHNDRIAWTASTSIDAQLADTTVAAGITEWKDTLRVNTMNGVVSREYTFRRTSAGPIVTATDGHSFVIADETLRAGAVHAISRAHGSDTVRSIVTPGTRVLVAGVDRSIALVSAASMETGDVLAFGIAAPDALGSPEDIAFDSRLPGTVPAIDVLAAEWEEVGGFDASRARRLDAVIDSLRSWDGRATVDSEAATLYVLWQERLRTYGDEGEHSNFRALEQVVALLERDRGSAFVPWGEVNRLRNDTTDAGHPVGGAPAWMDVMLALESRPGASIDKRVGWRGTMSVLAVELAEGIRARTVVAFGQQDQAGAAAQAGLFASSRLKPAWFTRADVLANARRSYRPGGPGSHRALSPR